MPTKTLARKAEPRVATPRPAAVVAIERMARLASGGVSPIKMGVAVDDILLQWSSEGLSTSDLRERVEQLQADLDAGLEAATDYAAEAETPAQKRVAENQVAALTVARDRLAAAMEGRR